MSSGPILVTGGAGFIGSSVVALLLAQQHEVRVIDDLSSGLRRNLPAESAQFSFTRGSILEREVLERAMRGCRAVVHLAAQVSVPMSVSQLTKSSRINCLGTAAALDAAASSGVSRFVFASSAAVYGTSPSTPSKESDPVVPGSPYAAEKAYGESLCFMSEALWGVQSIALRFFNVFGPRQPASSSYSGVITAFSLGLLKGAPLVMHGDGKQSRDFIYVGDVARSILAALQGSATGVCNVATGQGTSIRELGTRLAAAARVPAPRFTEARARPGDVRHSIGAVERARDALGWRAEVPLEEGLQRTILWYAESSAKVGFGQP